MNAFAELHFLRPWWLLLLAALPLFWIAARRLATEAVAWRRVVDSHLLAYLLEGSADKTTRTPLVLAMSAWTIAAVALAGPAWEREPMPLYRNQEARVFALELAPTMLAQDLKPSRLERAKFKLADLLARSRDRQTALIAYAGDAFVAAPLTEDANTVRSLVDALDPTVMPAPGNDASRAIAKAIDLVHQSGVTRGELILLADAVDASAIDAARQARAQGVTVSVLGIGTDSGAPIALPQGGFLKDARGNLVLPKLDENALRALANAGNGRYARIGADARDLDAVLGEARGDLGGARSAGTAKSERFVDRGPWLVLLLLPFALAGFRRGWLMALALAFVLPSTNANAVSFSDLWLRADQQAAAALADGDAKRAAELAQDPALRGGAAFRAGDFASAERAYAEAQGADAEYNRGNALAKQGRYEDALAAYDKALKQAPDAADAIANKQAVEEWLKRKKEDEQNKQSKSGNQKDKSDQQKSDNGDKSKEQQSQKDQNSQNGDKQDDKQSGQEDQQPSGEGEQKEGDKGQAGPHDQDNSQAKPRDGSASDEKAQQDLSKAVDKALANDANGKERPEKGEAAMPAQDEATREQQQALEQWLARVPDDPGGLLRRKFMLEYQRRQQRGEGR